MTIQDLAGNEFITQSEGMIGFVPSDVESALSLRIYPFIIESIREEDHQRGNRFVERFLEGPQSAWEVIDARIKDLSSLWSVTGIEDEYLEYMKWIVGWTSELDSITSDLDSETLRRLIDSSVPFWKKRGTENSTLDILNLITGARMRIWNWFDLRMIMGELIVGEGLQGNDPIMLSTGSPDFDENRMNVRIVDDGTLDRKLVRNLVRLTRPGGERITISYIGFLDQFVVNDDLSQWEENGAGEVTVVDGAMLFTAAGKLATVNVSGSESWRNYRFLVRLRGEAEIQFYRTSSMNYFFVHFDPTSNEISLRQYEDGVLANIETVDMSTVGVTLKEDVFYTIRVYAESVPFFSELAAAMVVNFEGSEIMSEGALSHFEGTIGVKSGSLATEIDQVELAFVPMDEDIIDIN